MIDRNLLPEEISGNTSLDVLSFPTIRAKIRRNDADGVRAFPYYPSLTGKSLVVEVCSAPGGSPTSMTVNFTSDGLLDAIASINAVSATDLLAYEDNGYLVLQSAHEGGLNYMLVRSGTAASILGFDLWNLGGYSQAGDIAPASSGGPTQNNPQSTKLIAHDEGLTSRSINRAIRGAIQGLEQRSNDLDREVPFFKVVSFSGGSAFFTLSGERLAIYPLLVGLKFDNIAIFDSTGQSVYAGTTRVKVTSVTYGPLSNAAIPFVTWGTPDGKSVVHASVPAVEKVSALAITAIQGNHIYISGATFQTANVQAGDILEIKNATNSTPFSHNGLFSVVAVPSEENLYVRSLGQNEMIPLGASSVPRGLNSLLGSGSYGDVTVYVGKFIPTGMKTGAGADTMYFNTNFALPGGTYYALLPVGVSLKNLNDSSYGPSGLSPLLVNDLDLARAGTANSFAARNGFLDGLDVRGKNSSSFLPSIRYMDEGGTTIDVIDHLGLPTGRLSRFYEGWEPKPNSPYYDTNRWYLTGATTVLIRNNAPDLSLNGLPDSHLRVELGISSTNYSSLTSQSSGGGGGYGYIIPASGVFAMTFEVAISDFISTSWYLGLSESWDPSAAQSVTMEHWAGEAFWTGRVTDSGGTTRTATAVAAVANQVHKIRIECFGASHTLGPSCRFFVDSGTPVTIARCPAVPMMMLFRGYNSLGSMASPVMRVWPVSAAWTRLVPTPMY